MSNCYFFCHKNRHQGKRTGCVRLLQLLLPVCLHVQQTEATFKVEGNISYSQAILCFFNY